MIHVLFGWAGRAASRRYPGAARPLRATALVLILAIAGGCISEAREREIGDTMASEVNPHLPLIHDSLVTTYLESLGTRISRVSARPNLEYRFYLVNTDAVNAFALPGGHVYVTRGLVERTADGAEFAGVLAHEIGHVAARHGVRKLQRQLRTGSLVNLLYRVFLGGEPALLSDNALELANTAWSARHSRRDEKEADRLAVRYLTLTGIDPEGVVSLLETVQRVEAAEERGPTGRMAVWLSSHPVTARRIDEARAEIENVATVQAAVPAPVLDAYHDFRILVMSYAPDIIEYPRG